MEDRAVPERIVDAVIAGRPEEVEEWLASVAADAAQRDVDQGVVDGIAALLSWVTFSNPFDGNSVRIVRLLISHGADVSHIHQVHSSPLANVLHSYGRHCSEEAVLSMIKLLLRAGADVHHRGSNGLLPLSTAIRKFAGSMQSSH